ncbi:MAG: hypothetical protein PHT80_10140, partial [Lentisphaeria bacterium]|nr:hypothetical protein [Lentisphaeria bacterium]
VVVILVVGYFDWFYFLSAAVEKRTSLNQKLEELQGQIQEKERCLFCLSRGEFLTIFPAVLEISPPHRRGPPSCKVARTKRAAL